MKRTFFLLFLACLPGPFFDGIAEERDMLNNYRAVATQWEEEIAGFEKKNATEKGSETSILFLGGSSLRQWKNMPDDFSPLPVIQRGFGGASISDLAVFADRLIEPLSFGAVVFLIGESDVRGNPEDKSPEEIRWFADYLIEKVRDHHGAVPIFFLEIYPRPAHLHLNPLIKDANAALRISCQQNPGVTFIPTREHFLREGIPDDTLFEEDGSQLNRKGSELRAKLIKPFLKGDTGGKPKI